MNILGIDTSSKAGSCAILQDDFLLGEFFINAGHTHSQTALPMVDHLLATCDITLSDMDYLAVTNGPGSFTGLRIGLSLVKGLAFPNQIPCVCVSTLEVLARNLIATPAVIVPAMDARRKQVYTAIFQSDGKTITRVTPDEALPIEEVGHRLGQMEQGANAIFIGDGAELCYSLLEEQLPKCSVAPAHLLHQRASSLCLVAKEQIALGNILSAEELTPSYLRLSQAERELKEKQEANNTQS